MSFLFLSAHCQNSTMLWSRQYGQTCAAVCLLRQPPETSTLPLRPSLVVLRPKFWDHPVHSPSAASHHCSWVSDTMLSFFLSWIKPSFWWSNPLTTERGCRSSGLSSPGLRNFACLLTIDALLGVVHSEWSFIPLRTVEAPLAVPSSGAAGGSGAILMPKLLLSLSLSRSFQELLYAEC